MSFSEVKPLEISQCRAIIFGVALSLLTLPIMGNIQFFLSHILLIAFIAFAMFFSFITAPIYVMKFTTWIVLFFGFNAMSAIYFGPGPRYAVDTVKILIYICSIAFLSYTFSMRALRNIAFGLSIGLPTFVFVSIFVFDTISWANGRLVFENAGGPNVFGSMAALCIIFALAKSEVSLLIRALICLVLFVALLATGSRANMLGIAVAVAYGPHLLKRFGWFAVAIVILAAVISLTTDVTALINDLSGVQRLSDAASGNVQDLSSGRSGIWAFLIKRAIQDPVSILFGRGGGSAEFMYLVLNPTFWSQHLLSPHSTWVGAFYYYGVLGFLVTACAFIYVTVFAVNTGDLLKRRLVLYYLCTAMVDNHYMGSQGIVFHAIAFSILFAPVPYQSASQHSGRL